MQWFGVGERRNQFLRLANLVTCQKYCGISPVAVFRVTVCYCMKFLISCISTTPNRHPRGLHHHRLRLRLNLIQQFDKSNFVGSPISLFLSPIRRWLRSSDARYPAGTRPPTYYSDTNLHYHVTRTSAVTTVMSSRQLVYLYCYSY